MSIQVESNAITGHDCRDDDAANNRRRFVVADPSPELVEIRNAVLAYREVEALSDRNILHALRATEAAMDKKIDAFLTRVPRTADDVVERIEVIAHENCWFTTHADDVPIRLDTFVATLKAAGNEPLHKGAISAPSAIGVKPFSTEPRLLRSSDRLWQEPNIGEVSSEFAEYLRVRHYVRKNMPTASVTPEPDDGPTAVDILVGQLLTAGQPIINRAPRTANEVAELAVVVRDQLFDEGSDEPHSTSDQLMATILSGILGVMGSNANE
jgi:hypothetical protein